MGTTDFGAQSMSFDYKSDTSAQTFNKLNYGLFEKGIYSGGLLTYISSSRVEIETFTIYAIDSVVELGVRIDTSDVISLEVSDATPYIILRFAWANIANNFADALAVSFGSILPDDIILGRCIYSSSVLTTTFDYSRRDSAIIADSILTKNNLIAIPTEPYTSRVYINSGTFTNSDKIINVSGGLSPSIAFPVTLGRIDLVWIDDDGAIQIDEGVDSGSPVAKPYSSRRVLAELRFGAGATYITGADIINVEATSTQEADSVLLGVPVVSTPTGGTSTSLSATSTVSEALEEVFARLIDSSGVQNDSIDSRHYADNSIDEAHINWGASATQVNAGDVPILDANTQFTATSVEAALDEVMDKSQVNTTAIGLNTTHRSSDGKNHSDVVSNNAKVTNQTHTGDVTGSIALSIGVGKVLNAHIGDDQVNSEHYANGSIDDIHLSTGIQNEMAANTAKNTNVTTNLGITNTTTTTTITSSDGTNATIPEATTLKSGVMSKAHHDKLDGIDPSANNYEHPTYNGDDFSLDTGALSGASVVSRVDINITTDTLGHVVDVNGTETARTLTIANLGITTQTSEILPAGSNGDIIFIREV